MWHVNSRRVSHHAQMFDLVNSKDESIYKETVTIVISRREGFHSIDCLSTQVHRGWLISRKAIDTESRLNVVSRAKSTKTRSRPAVSLG